MMSMIFRKFIPILSLLSLLFLLKQTVIPGTVSHSEIISAEEHSSKSSLEHSSQHSLELSSKRSLEHSSQHSSGRFSQHSSKYYDVKVFYYLQSPEWGESSTGVQECSNRNMKCDWEYSGDIAKLTKSFNKRNQNNGNSSITVAMYNIHSLWHKLKKIYPLNCQLKSDYSLVTSEESMKHPAHSQLFPRSFPNFDGYSTTSPQSTIQKIYKEAYLNETMLKFYTKKMKKFELLSKAGTYIASACHNKLGIEAEREKIVKAIRSAGFRIDGLGSCLRSVSPEGYTLKITDDTETNLVLKRAVISKYLFYMAFENVVDTGYVTEKVWDALVAGTVPVYWGDSDHLKKLLPHPKAAIFVSDFTDAKRLTAYLSYLSGNETAYEEHREWRKTYKYKTNTENNDLLRNSWYCQTCEWAINQKNNEINENTNRDSNDGKNLISLSSKDAKSSKVKNDGMGSHNPIRMKDKALRDKDKCT